MHVNRDDEGVHHMQGAGLHVTLKHHIADQATI